MNETNWEQRRYEIARSILPYCAEVTKDVLMSGHSIGDRFKGKTITEAVAIQSVEYADALIEELKIKEEKK